MESPTLFADPFPHLETDYSPYCARRFTLEDFLPETSQCSTPNDLVEPKDFKFIHKDNQRLDDALHNILTSNLVSVDCEGVELGRNGQLSIIQVATADHVYVFDVLSLGETLFSKGLKRALERPIPTKVFYDCRRDSDILYHQFGVKLKGVVDAALSEVFFRWTNGMGVPRFLKGYRRCVETYLGVDNPHFFQLKNKVSSMMSTLGTSIWIERPLPQELLEYAAYDVKYLRDLHLVLTQTMSKRNIRMIYAASTRFVRMERDISELVVRESVQWTQISPEWFSIN
jgi:ribonuclease D